MDFWNLTGPQATTVAAVVSFCTAIYAVWVNTRTQRRLGEKQIEVQTQLADLTRATQMQVAQLPLQIALVERDSKLLHESLPAVVESISEITKLSNNTISSPEDCGSARFHETRLLLMMHQLSDIAGPDSKHVYACLTHMQHLVAYICMPNGREKRARQRQLQFDPNLGIPRIGMTREAQLVLRRTADEIRSRHREALAQFRR